MSLLLRKELQVVLDKHDLEPYHAEICRHSKNLQLRTVCGKPFAIVHGVTFSRFDPTKTDIAYAAELLDLWCLRNNSQLDTYIDAFTKLQLAVEPENKLVMDKYRLCVRSVYNMFSNEQADSLDVTNSNGTIDVKKGAYEWQIKANGTLQWFNYDGSRESTKHQLAYPWKLKGLLDKKVYTAAIDLLHKNIEYRMVQSIVERIINDLNTCKD